ncbi:MAG TPA: sigma-70 family RNA polymerase sigma factor [Spirochaetia bacterium]|nr:sigma-70 family RNA polymerase sigma factor [Spirochaetia bacterium]
MAAKTDEDLVREFCKTQDEAAYIELMNRYLTKMRRLLFSVLPGSPEDREDAEQEILAALFFDLPRFRFGSAFGTFFYRYVRNKAVDLVRKNQREHRRVRAFRMEARSGVASASSPEDSLLLRESAQEVLDAVLALPDAERTLLFLKDSEELSVKQIAAVMSIPEGTVKSRLHRARERVAAALSSTRTSARSMEADHAT